MAGLFDGLEETFTSPLFLGGAGLAFGGSQGLFSGLEQGQKFKKGRRDEKLRAEREKGFTSLFDDPATAKQFGSVAPVIRAAGAEAGLPMAFDAWKNTQQQTDPLRRAQIAKLNEELRLDRLYGESDRQQKRSESDARIKYYSDRGDAAQSRASSSQDFWRRLAERGHRPKWSDDPEEPEGQPGQWPAQRPGQPAAMPAPGGTSLFAPRPPTPPDGVPRFLDPPRVQAAPERNHRPSVVPGLTPEPMRLGGPRPDYSVGEREVGAPNGVTARSPTPLVRVSDPKNARLPATQSNDASLLTEEERAMGITIDQKARRLRIDYLSQGRPPTVGHIWDLDAAGNLRQPLVKEKETKKGDTSPEMIASTYRKLNAAEKILGGDLDEQGRTKENGPWSTTRYLSDWSGGRYRPEIKQAMNGSHEAVMKTIMAISGKSFSKFELQNDLAIFKPLPSDTDEMSRSKIQSLKDIMGSLQEAKTSGLSEDEMERKYVSAIERATGIPFKSSTPSRRELSRPGAQPASSNGWKIQRSQ